MAFNLCPDDGLPRLWRPVAPGALGYTDGGRPIVSVLDVERNIQLLDKELLGSLPETEQLQVLHTGAAFVTV